MKGGLRPSRDWPRLVLREGGAELRAILPLPRLDLDELGEELPPGEIAGDGGALSGKPDAPCRSVLTQR